MSSASPEMSIVVPAYNEAARIGSTLDRLTRWTAGRSPRPEIVVVDDGSRDATPEIVRLHALAGVRLLRFAENRGKGAALRAGVLESVGAVVLLCDADLSTPIEEFERLEARLFDADVVLGSRDLPESRVTRHQPWPRELAGKAFNQVIRLCGVRGFRDTQCGFKLLRGEAARRLFAETTVDRFAYDVELIWLALERGYRVVEVGVEWRNDPASRVRVIRDGWRMLVDVVRFRRRHRKSAGGARRAGAR